MAKAGQASPLLSAETVSLNSMYVSKKSLGSAFLKWSIRVTVLKLG